MSRVFIALLLSIVCCLAKEPAAVDAPYNKVFDPWRACMDAEDLAKRGAPGRVAHAFSRRLRSR